MYSIKITLVIYKLIYRNLGKYGRIVPNILYVNTTNALVSEHYFTFLLLHKLIFYKVDQIIKKQI